MKEAKRLMLVQSSSFKGKVVYVRHRPASDAEPGWGVHICPFCHTFIEYCDCEDMSCSFPYSECCREWCEDQGWNVIRGRDISCPIEGGRK